MARHDYAKVLAELEDMRSGLAPERYVVVRARLMHEAARSQKRWWHVVPSVAVLFARCPDRRGPIFG